VTSGAGFPVVLTADRTLMAGYRLLFDGMLAASQTTTTPRWIVNRLLLPAAPRREGRAGVAPLGLRRVEAALLEGGFGEEEVAVVAPQYLDQAVGRATRLVAVSSGEPCGLGMNSSTMTAVAGGEIYPRALFRELLQQTRRRVQAVAPEARVIVGGPGAWQLAADPEQRQALGVDHVITGYCEGTIAAVCRGLLEGAELPPVIAGEGVPAARIPRIRGASTMGVVEISRGCGLGCSFCTIARAPMLHLPLDTILADVETNLAAGQDSIALLSEDFFRYGASGTRTAPGALLGLLRQLREGQKNLRLLQVDHVNLASVAQFSDEELREVRRLLVGPTACRYPWVNVGLETASGELLAAAGGAAKMGGTTPADWAQFCAGQVRRLGAAGFLPLVSLVLGLPGEQEEDARRALAWVEQISDLPVTVFPVLYAPVDGRPPLTAADLNETHWRLLQASYRLNFRWIPRMYWDNQQAAGVPASRRIVLQALGKGQVAQWTWLLGRHRRRSRR
jgi:radical SAM superfamily enzyme YgiQ (UPF0313 family)